MLAKNKNKKKTLCFEGDLQMNEKHSIKAENYTDKNLLVIMLVLAHSSSRTDVASNSGIDFCPIASATYNHREFRRAR